MRDFLLGSDLLAEIFDFRLRERVLQSDHLMPHWCVRQLGALMELSTSRNANPFVMPIMNTLMGNLIMKKQELSNKIV